MKDKILFWIDANLIYLGLAKFLQDRYDCELFAIAETTSKTKKFLYQQQIVKFNKIWYFFDQILKTNKKPGISYLISFEEKYQVNLLLLAYNERIFYEYNEYYKFTTDEVLLILEQECRLFESILDEVKPDFLVMAAPNFHYNYLLSKICKARGIKTLILGPSRLGGRSMISEELDKMDDTKITNPNTMKTLEELQKFLKEFDVYIENEEFKKKYVSSKWLKFRAALQFILSNNDNIKINFTYYGRTKLKIIWRALIWLLRERYRKFFINKYLSQEIDEKTPFIYFPLQIDIESTLLIGTPFYTNQLELIKHIVKSLPIGYNLYVKDHPLQNTRGWRSVSFYKQIMNLPNVRLLHHSISPNEIIKRCSLVITIASTAGLEAAFHKKPSIVFADVLYSMLPSVYKLKTIDELPHAIRTCLRTNVDVSDLNNYVDLIIKNSFEFSLSKLFSDYDDFFFYGGFLINVDISQSKMISFLEKNRERFEKLTLEHIKKIEYYRKSKQN